MNILTKEQIKEIRDVIQYVNLAHFKRNWWRGYNTYKGFSEEQEHAAEVLSKYRIQDILTSETEKLTNECALNLYLTKCEKLNEILDIVYKYNWSYEEMQMNFNIIDEYFYSNINKQKDELQNEISRLLRKDLKIIINKELK